MDSKRRIQIRLQTLMRAVVIAAPVLLLGARPSGTVQPVTIGRLHYDGGGDWYANPSSLANLLAAVGERTALDVETKERIVTLAPEAKASATGDEC